MFDAIHEFLSQANETNELELKFNEFGYHHGIGYDTFKRVVAQLKKERYEHRETKTIVELFKHKHTRHQVRRIGSYIEHKRNVMVPRETFEKLKEIHRNYGIKTTESTETKMNVDLRSYDLLFKRERHRYSFSNKTVRIDVTCILQKNEKVYELELEFLQIPDKEYTTNIIEKILRLVQNSDMIFSYDDTSKELVNYSKLVNTSYFIGSMPRTLIPENLQQIACGYSVTDKTDGQRCLLYINNIGQMFFIRRPRSKMLSLQYIGRHGLKNCLFDGELVDTSYYVFDCAIFKRKDIRNENLIERLKHIASVVSKSSIASLSDYKIYAKTFYVSHNGKSLKINDEMKEVDMTIFVAAQKIWAEKAKLKYDLDGLIFTPIYKRYDNQTIYKWKDVNTYDFYYTNKKLHVGGYVKYNNRYEYTNIPFSGIDGKGTFITRKGNTFEHVKLSISPSLGNLTYKKDDVVLECELTKKGFKIVKERTDKTFGNYVNVVNEAHEADLNKLKLSELDKTYYTCVRKFHNAIKRNLIQEHCKKKTVLDIGIGAGGDLKKYEDAHVTKLVGFDVVDMEYKTNKLNFKFHKMNKNVYKIKNYIKQKFDVINIFFAAHYFFKSQNTFDAFVSNVKDNLEKNGKLIMTVLDGGLVHCKRKLESEVYKIIKKYESPSFLGSKIDVKLYGTKYFENKSSIEYLIHVQELVHLFDSLGLKLVTYKNFKEYKLDELNQLSNEEKEYSFLNAVLVFRLKD